MSTNPFKIMEKVDGSYEIERIPSTFMGIHPDELEWREDEYVGEVLTLNEILDQVKKQRENLINLNGKSYIPFIRVIYETGLWGVIFEVGNCSELGEQWIVHGITKGYA